MQLLQAVQLREWDQFSIREQQIESVDLMERAAQAAVDWITQRYGTEQAVYIFCGSGNNGGDGLAISRLLFQRQYQIFVYTLPVVNPSADWQIQLQRLTDIGVPATPLEQEPDFPCLHANSMVIDALYGTGLNRVITGITANLIQYLNASETRRIAIDIPSGLSCDQPILAPVMLAAQHTLTFQCLKRSFLFAETAPWVGEIHILDIQLSRRYLQQVSSDWQWVDGEMILSCWKKRQAFAHKGQFGHALLIAGSQLQMGAAILSVRAALRSGPGKLTAAIPASGAAALFVAAPEAMQQVSGEIRWDQNVDTGAFQAIGIGPGIGLHPTTRLQLETHLNTAVPLIVDADALNILASIPNWQSLVPPQTILTPHVKEFDRLFGAHTSDWNRIETARNASQRYGWVIVLKGRFTRIIYQNHPLYFNSTGNAGLAKGGSGDVLTGILTGLRAQGYTAWEAALVGVYWHGLAADAAAQMQGLASLLPGDLINELGPTARTWDLD